MKLVQQYVFNCDLFSEITFVIYSSILSICSSEQISENQERERSRKGITNTHCGAFLIRLKVNV